jgi:hypothetical protein
MLVVFRRTEGREVPTWSKLGALSLWFLGIASDLSAARGEPDRLLSSWREAEAQTSKGPIGMCWIEGDGTIVVVLRRTADDINVSMLPQRYPPTDPDYDTVLKHVGPLRPAG